MNDLLIHDTQHSIYSHHIVRSRFSFHTQADVRASPTKLFPPSLSSVPLTRFVKSGATKQTSNYESSYQYRQRDLVQGANLATVSVSSRSKKSVGEFPCVFSALCQRTVTKMKVEMSASELEDQRAARCLHPFDLDRCMKRESAVRPIYIISLLLCLPIFRCHYQLRRLCES